MFFWNSVAFSMIQWMLAIWSLVPLSFLNHIIISTELKGKHTFEQDELFCYLITEMTVRVVQSCPTLCNPMDYTFHGILQARILEWVAFPFSRGSSKLRDQTQVSWIAGEFFTSWATREAKYLCSEVAGISPLGRLAREDGVQRLVTGSGRLCYEAQLFAFLK